jgi:LuxR family transcriptional regulator, maltose regulon positive regulatory protein
MSRASTTRPSAASASARETGRLRLPAKVLCPTPGNAVARTRLFQALDALTEAPIGWLHAAAGSGKTTLLTTYLAARQRRVVWYDVDVGDTDVVSVFHYLRLAAENLLGASVELPLPRPAAPAAQRVFARRFFEALFAHLPRDTCIVFDNYQEAHGEPLWNELFRELCAVVSPRVRILVASRSAPPASLARYFANDELRLLSNTDLRFDEHEVQQLLHDRKAAPQIDSAHLLALTGGWTVAVALLVKWHSAHAHFAHGPLTRGPDDELQAVFDFLACEVFAQLDAASRVLLPPLALLPSFTAAMAVELTGRHDVVPMLQKLQREQLLVERQGEDRFRLHDLLRVFLLQRQLSTEDAACRCVLSVRAAWLLAGDDQFSAAAELLIESHSWTDLADLVEQHAPVLAAQTRLATLAGVLGRMPALQRQARPWLLYWHAASVLGQHGSEAQLLAERAFHDFRAAGDVSGVLLSWALVVQTIITTGEALHPLDEWLETRTALGLCEPTPEIAVKVALSEVLARGFRDGSTASALAAADRALELVSHHGTHDDRLLASASAKVVYLWSGQTERIFDLQRCALDPLAQIMKHQFDSAWALSKADLKTAAREAERGLAIAESSGVDVWSYLLQGGRALSAIGRRDFGLAKRLLDSMIGDPVNSFRLGYHAYIRGWLEFEQGDVEAALRWNQEGLRTARRVGFGLGLYCGASSQVIYEAARGDAGAVRQALSELSVSLGPAPSPFFATAADIARMYARLCAGDHSEADLRAALKRARRFGYGLFLGSRVVRRLVTAALEYDIETEHALELLKGYELEAGPEAYLTAAWPWPVKIRALGPLQIDIDQRPVQFGRKPPSVLLALLKVLASASEPIPLERLQSALWPGYRDRAPRGSVDTALYRLRKLLGSDATIITENGRAALHPQLCWTDTRALSLVCDRIEELACSGGAPLERSQVEHYQRKLLDLYRGPLGNDDDPAAVIRAREYFRRRFARATRELEHVWLRLGETTRAARWVALASARDGQQFFESARIGE